MIVRFRAEPSQPSNLRARFFSLDRSTLLADVNTGITELVAGSGSYQVDAGSITGYWFVLITLIDTGEVTADGFASQFTPEVTDCLPSGTGTGLYSIVVTVQSSVGNAPVVGAAVTITSIDGLQTIAWGLTDGLGKVYFALDAGSYEVLIKPPTSMYGNLSPQTLVVVGNASPLYTLVSQPINAPVSPSLTTVRFIVINLGAPVEGAAVSANLIDENNTVDTSLVEQASHCGTTDENGICDLILIQKASFTRGGTYRIRVTTRNGVTIHDRNVTVPTLATVYAEDLPSA